MLKSQKYAILSFSGGLDSTSLLINLLNILSIPIILTIINPIVFENGLFQPGKILINALVDIGAQSKEWFG